MIDDGSGRILRDWLAYYDHATSSWKTRQACLPLEIPQGQRSPRSSAIWPRSGMTVSGTLYPRPTLVRPTSANVSGLWPSPNAHDSGFNPDTLKPVDKEGNTPEHPNQRWYHPTTGRLVQKGLTQVAQIWPTPTALDDRVTRTTMGRGLDNLTLQGAVAGISESDRKRHAKKQWPTPTAQDAKNDGGPSQWERNSDPLNVAVKRWPTLTSSPPPLEERGSLNPTWVEWLMGYPSGWTDLKD